MSNLPLLVVDKWYSGVRASQQGHCTGYSSRCCEGFILPQLKGLGCRRVSGHRDMQMLPLHVSTAGTKSRQQVEPGIKARGQSSVTCFLQWVPTFWRFYYVPKHHHQMGTKSPKTRGRLHWSNTILVKANDESPVGWACFGLSISWIFPPSACLPSYSSRQCRPNGLLGK